LKKAFAGLTAERWQVFVDSKEVMEVT